MAKKTLEFDVEDHIDFDLVGIICAFKDYRLCFEINQLLCIELKKAGDLEIKLEKKGSTGLFSLYQYINADDEQYYIITNKGNNAWFIPELKHVDYFMMIKNKASYTSMPDIILQLKSIRMVNSVLLLDAAKLKSVEHFLYIEPEEQT